VNIGVPKEIKSDERRVAMTPAGVRELVSHGHTVRIERGAGAGAGFDDDAYNAAGAEPTTVDDVYAESELIVKVKEPQEPELLRLDASHTLFCYLHLAADPRLALRLAESGARCIAYETVEDHSGRLPLLAPMSDIAGRFAAQAGAFALSGPAGGRGLLIGGAPGVSAADVVIVGGGVAGTAAAAVCSGMGARVTIVDRSVDRLRQLDDRFGNTVRTVCASEMALEALVLDADLVIGAVLVPGDRAPRLVRREHLKMMRPGSALVDISIDQGGCFETSRPTTHSEPVFVTDNVVHYCVTNIPGAVPFTSTAALTNVTLTYIAALANQGIEAALAEDHGLARGLNVEAGQIVHDVVGRAIEPVAAGPT
jgi:alanine dehydrogenase